MNSGNDNQSELAELRAEIDEIDQQIVLLMGVRFRCTDRVGEIKLAEGIDPSNPQRVQQKLEQIRHLAIDAGVPPDLAVSFVKALTDTVIEQHRQQRERPYS